MTIHPRLAMTIWALAEISLERGDCPVARTQAERPLSLVVEHPHIAGADVLRASQRRAAPRLGEHVLVAAAARREYPYVRRSPLSLGELALGQAAP